MRASPILRVLRSTVAVGAVALGSAAANAACTTANGVVTCSDANTTDQVNSAINQSPPPSVAINILQGATVTRGFAFRINPNNPPFSGAIGFTNSGTVGTTGANVDFNYFGSIGNTANTFTLDNRGTQNGSIFVFNVGGAINGTNSGTVTRGIDLRGAGPITFTNTGTVSNNSFFGASAITLISSRPTSQTGADGITRTTETGGPIISNIGGTVGVPATGTSSGQPQGILARSVGGVDVAVTGTAGIVQAQSRGDFTASQFTTVRGATTTVQTRVFDNLTVGENARVTVGAAGQVTGVNVSSGTGTATVIIDGAVVAPNFNGFGEVSASAFGTNSVGRGTDEFGNSAPFLTNRTANNTSISTGGAALIDVSATGRVEGSVGAASNAGSATVRIAGQVGTTTNFSSARATSDQTNSTFQSRSIQRADGSFEFVLNATESTSGGAALVAVAATGQVSGSLLAQGNGSATVDNAGRVRGGAGATSNRLLTTDRAENITRTIATDEAGVRTQVDRSATSFTEQSLGGTASVTNRLGGTIQAGVGADGVRGATVDNAGSIAGGVSVRSIGNRRDGVSTDRTTTTSTPATGGGTTTTVVRDFSNTEATRATGGAVTGTYSGNVGLNANSFSRVSQNGTTASAATVTGTLFADFIGTAGGQNRDFANSGNSRRVTQPSGASTREETNATRNATTQVASTSSLTVGPTGRITNSSFGPGNVSLTSTGGDARFTLDGGRVDGSVDIEAGSGLNTAGTSETASTFTRAQSQPGVFVPEIQQSQISNSSSENRAAAGTATATINAGSVGGDLTVSGTGAGAGTLGANVLVNGTVSGDLAAFALRDDTRSTSNDVATRTGPNTVSRTRTTSSSAAPAANSGGVLVTVNGTVGGGIAAGAGAGPATVNLNGRANSLTRDGVVVTSFDFASRSDSVQALTGTSFFSGNQTTSSQTTGSSNPVGGVATLNVAANQAMRNAGTSSIEGDIFVQGLAGSVLNVAAGSRIVERTGGVLVGITLNTSTNSSTSTFTNGALTGTTTSTLVNAVGGPATVNNAGVIGSAINPSGVSVASIGGATVNNTGTINGSITASARSANRVTTATTTITPATQTTAASRRTVTNNTLFAAGGNAQVNNSSLVNGGVTVVGATGGVTNSGVIRGALTLGGNFSNFSTTTTTTTTGTGTTTVVAPSVANPARFTQTYTVNQNGLLLGGVNVTGTTTVDPSGATVRTSDVNATVNLNDGSITLGNITGGADTRTNVNLTGSGFLGIAQFDTPSAPVRGQPATAFQPTPSLARFAAIDPQIGTTVPLPSGSRISGVQTLTKSGDGTFVIVGAPLVAAAGTAPANQTLDIGTLRVSGGELQLGLVNNAGTFGIRGNVENSANLVLGRRIVNAGGSAVQGINISVLGNLANTASGNLIVGANPNFVLGSGTSGFVPFGPGAPGLASTNSFVRIDGNLALAGTVAVQGVTGGLYEAGRAYDLFSVSGTVSNTATARSTFASPFVSFVLTPRSEGGRTIVSLDVVRASFVPAATDPNSTAAANAFQATLPLVFGGIRAGASAPNAAFVQDLASIISALDTRFSADQAAQVFRELSSGEFYGSLSAVSTTIPFGEATDGLSPAGKGSGVGIWFRPTGQFGRYKRNDDFGASQISLDNYGGSIGLNFATGAGGHVGIAGGYSKLDVDAETPERAEAETYMVGIYGAQQIGGLHVSAQAVYGKSEWDASRTLSLLARTATSSFDSEEIRASLRIAYTIAPLPGLDISPFARVEARRYDFDAIEELGAGAVGLVVGKRAKTIVTPEVGLRMSGAVGQRLRPFAEGSYIFQEDVGSDRRVSFVSNRPQEFTLRGVDPGDAIKAAIGVAADIGLGTAFVRGDYASGGDQQVGSVRAGLLFTF